MGRKIGLRTKPREGGGGRWDTHGVRESRPSSSFNHCLLLATGNMRKGMSTLELENECAIAFVLLLHLLVTDSSSTLIISLPLSYLVQIRHSIPFGAFFDTFHNPWFPSHDWRNAWLFHSAWHNMKTSLFFYFTFLSVVLNLTFFLFYP